MEHSQRDLDGYGKSINNLEKTVLQDLDCVTRSGWSRHTKLPYLSFETHSRPRHQLQEPFHDLTCRIIIYPV